MSLGENMSAKDRESQNKWDLAVRNAEEGNGGKTRGICFFNTQTFDFTN